MQKRNKDDYLFHPRSTFIPVKVIPTSNNVDTLTLTLTASLCKHGEPEKRSHLIVCASPIINANLSNLFECKFALERVMLKVSAIVLCADMNLEYKNYLKAVYNFMMDSQRSIKEEYFDAVIAIFGKAVELHRTTIINTRKVIAAKQINFVEGYTMIREINDDVILKSIADALDHVRETAYSQHFDNAEAVDYYESLRDKAIKDFQEKANISAIVSELFEKGSE